VVNLTVLTILSNPLQINQRNFMSSTKIYYSGHYTEQDDKLHSMLFETECEYALSEGHTHLRDFTGHLFQLSRSTEGVITLIEVDTNESVEPAEPEDEQDYICSACASLEALDAAILAHINRTKVFNNDTSDVLLKLAHAKQILMAAHQ